MLRPRLSAVKTQRIAMITPWPLWRFFGAAGADGWGIGFGFGGSVLYCGIGLVLFMLLTAYDTQKLQQMYAYYAGDPELAEKASIYGALTLYLDFINIFLYVVRLLGNNRRRD